MRTPPGLRREASINIDDLKDAVPKHQESRLERSDLTFGSYAFSCETPSAGTKLGWRLDREQVVDFLEQVRDVRNYLMHLATDPLSEEKYAVVNGLLQLLSTAEPRP
ncbi:hypothetical protein [Nocardia sp. bgisy118]|uniref:hypothetical protein n=1 Tax=Nocardia sp. bgisy118 TaxID=3413786 RepID=UPI003F49FD5C